MSRTPMYDPLTSDARSSWLAGLTEACNKLSGVLDMKTATFENLNLPELYISETDRYRIYQAPLGNKLWLSNPAPVIKKNGTVITPDIDGFEIDYLGGSIAFEGENGATQADVFTASATYIVDGSNQISEILKDIETLEEESGKNKGSFQSVTDLENAYPTGTPGDFAIISSENAIYIWDDTAKEWVNANAAVDLTDYFTKQEIQQMLDTKQDEIQAKEIIPGSGDSSQNYFYAGDKTWVDLLTKIRTCALSGLVTTDDSQVQAADSLLIAIGKLQAQINGFIPPIVGTSAPTADTAGIVGQDFINTSNGDKYRLVSISAPGTSGKVYNWEMYGKTTLSAKTISINKVSWSNNSATITDSFIQSGSTYGYLIAPTDFSREDYQSSGIYASAVTTNAKIVFHCDTVPSSNITVNICRLNGENLNGYVYNTGASGASSKDAVTVTGSGHITMEQILGTAPYDIQFTTEEPSDWTAADVVYDGTTSGLEATNVQQAIDKNYEQIQTKQPTITGTAGQVVGFGADGGAQAVQGWSNPNLLDNWYFPDPINQRGKTEYSKNIYTIDRWNNNASQNSAFSLINGIHVKSKLDIFQYIEMDLKGRTVTLSVLTNLGFAHGTCTLEAETPETNQFYTVSSGNGVFGILGVLKSGRYQVSLIASSEVTVKAVKLELGPQPTLANQDASGNWVLNDPPPNKGLELLKCQRYYQVFSSADMRPTKAVDFRPPLRVSPALSTIEINGVTYYTADANL